MIDLGELTTFTNDARAPVPVELRDYQMTAANAIVNELRSTRRAILQMACRCGKTLVAYAVACQMAAAPATFQMAAAPATCLFLVPGLALLRQTAEKLYSYASGDISLLLVGSDMRPVALGASQLAMTTDPVAIQQYIRNNNPLNAATAHPRWVICTYQSSPLLVDLIGNFSLIMYDEAHRICGGRAPRPFNSVLLASAAMGATRGASPPLQLFMSATPVYDPITTDMISMRDRELFGGVASRYYLRSGIDAGYVNNFRLQLIAYDAGAPDEDRAMAGAIVEAMRSVDKLLVFCRDIAHADRLAAATALALAASNAASNAANISCEQRRHCSRIH